MVVSTFFMTPKYTIKTLFIFNEKGEKVRLSS